MAGGFDLVVVALVPERRHGARALRLQEDARAL
jgi:hypothetical protein